MLENMFMECLTLNGKINIKNNYFSFSLGNNSTKLQGLWFISSWCFNILKKNNSVNSTYNGIAFTVDMLDDSLDKVRLFTLRSFGESLYHSITDASLEFGFKSLWNSQDLIKLI